MSLYVVEWRYTPESHGSWSSMLCHVSYKTGSSPVRSAIFLLVNQYVAINCYPLRTFCAHSLQIFLFFGAIYDSCLSVFCDSNPVDWWESIRVRCALCIEHPKVMMDGEVDGGAWSCGMVAGLINDIPTVQELMDRIMNEATSTIYDRLAGMQ